jgi:hypothetical protein
MTAPDTENVKASRKKKKSRAPGKVVKGEKTGKTELDEDALSDVSGGRFDPYKNFKFRVF